MSLYEEVTCRLPDLIAHRRFFHTYAEEGYALDQTIHYIKTKLDTWNITYVEPVKGALYVDIGKGDPALLLRADMDALPMAEENDLPYKSVTPYAHTCGHDLHAAMMLEAIYLTKQHENELRTAIRFVFQPDEEGVTGARTLIQYGILKPSIRSAFALHVSPTMETGVIFYKTGSLYASSDTISITVHGHGGHGAAPHHARDPIFSAVQIYNAMQGLISREVAPHEMAILSICTFQGGEAFNVIPPVAQLTGTLRTYNKEIRAYLKKRLQHLVPKTAEACGTNAVISFPTGTAAVDCDPILQEELLNILVQALPEGSLKKQIHPFSWSEDFGLFGEEVPISMMTLGAQYQNSNYSIHDPLVQFDESAMVIGCTALTAVALTFQ